MKRRTRTISIRLLEDEYQYLRQVFESRGARSISDLARKAVYSLLAESDPIHGDTSSSALLTRIERRLQNLEAQMKRITKAQAAR